ncbi:protein NRT1/ PTR FAMILY 3.1-like [Syzygium oleosum]|uniref:protein NRT1/ PTR FAMILY 3.1-like n=1 Tax=Syzygium oleosum TaxID=219896 RepID=UPI0011D1C169|nr:protein NRT1/ PTR FAMILY 3.1-like [Syzygium oleosum]
MEEGDQKHGTKQKGGMVTMPFIFANEVCDKLAVVGFNANMINYLTTKLHMPMTKAANTLTNFGGTASLTPLLGAYIADAYAGRFWTITVASVIYVVGMTLLTLSAVIPQLLPPPCNPSASSLPCQEANGGQLAVLYMALLLGAIGSGGIRPCVVAFGADQFDETDPKQSTKTWKYFNWYYFVMGVSILVAVTVVVYVQEDVGWGLGLGIPTVLMFLSVIALVCGHRLYRILDPAGSPFTRLLQVSVAAFRKRKVSVSGDRKAVELYRNDELDTAISLGGKLVHTEHMKFLDKAAFVTQEDDPKSPNLWRLSTVHRVEELKSVIRMGPIWAAGILLFTAYAQQNTFSIQQAKTMDRRLSKSFQVPSGSMLVFTMISMLTTIAFYDRVFVPVARRFTGLERGITFLHRMGIGFAISILATLVAGLVEVKRKQAASQHGLTDSPHSVIPISAFWLVPQYSLHGIAEAFMSIGHLEFFYDQAPESMRSTATALFWTTISAGNYLSTLLVSVVHRYTAGDDGSNWLPDDNLNRGKLEYFYWLLTLLQAVNFVYYVCCAKFYTFKPVQVHGMEGGDKSEEDEVELASRA